ncbi:hypothetical protein HWV62_24025 [Athelia sp. TMB]|nr:hypothetical protein HWV62_24025 [Athelia sp. TMB]
MPLHCRGCGQTFPNAEGSGTQCALCAKREQVESRVYGSAEEKSNALQVVEDHASGKRTEEPRKSSGKARAPSPEVYTVEDSSDMENAGPSSDVEIVPEPSKSVKKERAAAMAPRIAELQAKSSSLRLSKKPADSSVSKQTKSFLKKKNKLYAAATSHAHSPLIQFRVDMFFMNDSGTKRKTSIPIHARSFSPSDRLDAVFSRLVDMVNEKDGHWATKYPGKPLQKKGPNAVLFVFPSRDAIPPEYMTQTVLEFWDEFSPRFKPADVTGKTVNLAIQIPSSTVDDPLSDSDEEPQQMSAPKRKKRTQGGPPRVKREKIEVDIKLGELSDDNKFEEELRRGEAVVKAEPMPDSDLRLRVKTPFDTKLEDPKVKLNVPLKQQISYIKHHCDAKTLDIRAEPANTVYSGRLSVLPLKISSLPRTFELIEGGRTTDSPQQRYLARRMDGLGVELSTPEIEIAAGEGEILRGWYLAELLKAMGNRATRCNIEIDRGLTTPDLFMAIIQNQVGSKSTMRTTRASSSKAVANSNLVICQPYIEPTTFVDPADQSDIIATLSHFSLVFYNGERVLTQFKVARNDNNGCDIIFAPISHTILGDSGLGDDGEAGIDAFRQVHTCNDFCEAFGMDRLQTD